MTTKTMSPKLEQQFRANARQVLVDNMLTESAGLTEMKVLEEASGAPGALIVEGKVGQCGTPTANKRLYERRLMAREIQRLQEKIGRRALLASVDHPTDGKSRIMDSGAICLGLRVEADGSVFGKYEIVEEADGGRNLAAFLRRGCQVGMSSRGVGSTHMDATGNHVVGEDFKLHGFDFVADPACKDAFPKLMAEDIDPDGVTEDELRVRFPSLVEQIENRARQVGAAIAEQDTREAVERDFDQALEEARDKLHEDIKLQVLQEVREKLREDFAAKLLHALQHQKTQVEEVVRSELLSDPEVAGAKKFMEDLAERLHPFRPSPDQKNLFADYDARIEDLQQQLGEQSQAIQERNEALEHMVQRQVVVEGKARSLGYRLYIERAVAGFEHADQMREMIGDPDQFDDPEALQQHVTTVIRQVNEAHQTAEEEASRVVKLKEHKAQLAATKAKVASNELSRVRDEFQGKIHELAEEFDQRLRRRDQQLDEAAGVIGSLEAELVRARQLANDASLAAYAERRTLGHPRRDDIMAAVQSGRVQDQSEVQHLAEQWDTRGDEPGGVSERVRRAMGQGREAPNERERAQFRQLHEDRKPIPGLEGFDTTMGEIRRLAGIGQDNNGRRRI